MPCQRTEASRSEQCVNAPSGSCTSVTPSEHRGEQQNREAVRENEVSILLRDSSAFAKTGLLVFPVVKRCSADYQVEIVIRKWQMFRSSRLEAQTFVLLRQCLGDLDHRGGWIDANKFDRVWQAHGELTNQEPCPTPDVSRLFSTNK